MIDNRSNICELLLVRQLAQPKQPKAQLCFQPWFDDLRPEWGRAGPGQVWANSEIALQPNGVGRPVHICLLLLWTVPICGDRPTANTAGTANITLGKQGLNKHSVRSTFLLSNIFFIDLSSFSFSLLKETKSEDIWFSARNPEKLWFQFSFKVHLYFQQLLLVLPGGEGNVKLFPSKPVKPISEKL